MTRLYLPVAAWPELDRTGWLAAQAPPALLEGDKPASHWGPPRRRIVEQACGQWLGYLARQGALDPSCAPGARATKTHLREFVLELQSRVAPASVSMMAGALLRMLVVLEPDRDWTALARVYRHLKRTALPSRDKLARMVAATELFALGIRLMETCQDGPPQRVYKATRYRDGLMIALLIASPMRLRNLTGLVVGRHLILDGRDYRIELTAAETKTGRPYHAALPSVLTPYLDRHLREHRAFMQSIARSAGNPDGSNGRLWLGRQGAPLSSKGVRRQIELRTKAAFGRHVWPHLFRDCAVTELVDAAPEQIAIAPDLLGHADLRTTQRYYIQAKGMTAHFRVQEVIAARRRAAAARA